MAAGESFEVTDRGRPVAVLLRTMPSGLARLERLMLVDSGMPGNAKRILGLIDQ